jgi:hypothetical protein
MDIRLKLASVEEGDFMGIAQALGHPPEWTLADPMFWDFTRHMNMPRAIDTDPPEDTCRIARVLGTNQLEALEAVLRDVRASSWWQPSPPPPPTECTSLFHDQEAEQPWMQFRWDEMVQECELYAALLYLTR